MRHSTLVASAMVLLGVGLVTARLGAQTARNPPIPADLAAQGILKAGAEATLTFSFQEQKLKDALRGPEILDAPTLAVDCAMIMIKGDPAIDPKILKQPPSDRVMHATRAVLVPTCTK